MQRHGKILSRVTRSWNWPATLFVIGTLAVGWLALADAMASILAKRNPGLALWFWPGDARGLTSQADALALSKPTELDRAAQLARQSLTAAPLQPKALRILAMASVTTGNDRQGDVQFRLSDRLSRRDLLTRLWAIEDAVRRGDVSGALRNYDVALRTEPDSQSLLFPLLASGLNQSEIRAGMLPYLRKATPWTLAFVLYVAEKGDNPGVLARMLASGAEPTLRTAQVSSAMLERLLASGNFGDAMVYARKIPGYSAQLDRNLALNDATTRPALRPLTWTPLEQQGVSGRLDPTDSTIDVFVDSGAAGDVLTRFVSLPPGHYELVTTRVVTTAGQSASALWKLDCLRGGHFVPHWRGVGANANASRGQEQFTVTGDCAHQHLTLSVIGGAEAVPLDYKLTGITLRRLSGPRNGRGR